MAGWDLKEGILIGENEVYSDEEYWRLFNVFFSNSSWKRNSYKFVLLKALSDNLFNTIKKDNKVFISFDSIFEKFTENYWNLVVKFNLKQMRKGSFSNTSKIETILLSVKNSTPVLSELEFADVDSIEKAKIIHEVKKACKRYVIGALYNDFEGKIYSFNLKGDGVFLSRGIYNFLLKYKPEIETLNYYYWAKFLEQINDESATARIIDKLELSTPRRRNLFVYRELLYKEFEEKNCFYCGTKLNKNAHVDHFIPWSFIKDDKIWNFVLSCPKCNSMKNNKLPSLTYLDKLKKRNVSISKRMPAYDEFQSYDSHIIDDMWNYAKKSGYKEWDN